MVIKRHPINVGGLTLEVATQDVPSLGSPMERLIGSDLYVSLVRRDKLPPISKGMLVQSKWDDKLANDPLLDGQCSQMLRKTKESYVWAYGRHGIQSFAARAVTGAAPLREVLSAGELITAGLRCNRGDERIGRDLTVSRPQAMTTMLNRLRANAIVDFEINSNDQPSTG